MGSYFDNPAFPSENSEFLGWVVDHKVENGQILYKVRIPSLHYTGVKDEHLPFIPAEYPAGLFGATTSFGALDKGQLVRIRKDGGQGATGFGTIRSVYQPVIRSQTGLPGNEDLSAKLGAAYKQLTRAIRSADLQKVLNDKGVEVVKLVEKELFRFDDLIGVASHAASIGGVIIPQITQISTALDAATSIITSDMLSKLPGTQFSIGNLLNQMPKILQDELFKVLPSNIADALNSTLKLTSNFDVGSFGGAVSGVRVNLDVFMPNAVALLKDVKSVDEMFSALNKLTTDTTLHGLDALGDVFQDITGAFGGMQLKLGVDGSITTIMGEDMTKALSAFTSSMSSFTSAAGNMFDTVEDLAGKLQRLQPELNTAMNTVLNTIKSDATHIELMKVLG